MVRGAARRGEASAARATGLAAAAPDRVPAVAYVPDLETDEVTTAQLAVDSKVEQSNGAFWPTILPLFHSSR